MLEVIDIDLTIVTNDMRTALLTTHCRGNFRGGRYGRLMTMLVLVVIVTSQATFIINIISVIIILHLVVYLFLIFCDSLTLTLHMILAFVKFLCLHHFLVERNHSRGSPLVSHSSTALHQAVIGQLLVEIAARARLSSFGGSCGPTVIGLEGIDRLRIAIAKFLCMVLVLF